MRTNGEVSGAGERATWGDGAAAPAPAPIPGGPPRLDSAALFQRAREIVIVHGGQEYRLRITKADKLILTK
jgi:hemin uptake protein HemP